MEPIYISELAYATQGVIKNCQEDYLIKGISTDSRAIKSKDLYVPIIGENFDGHIFIDSAISNGASAVLSDRDLQNERIIYIKVKDTEKALGDIAKFYRARYNIPAIGITGSSGKTTTKEMVASVLNQSFKVLKNEGNYNNTIGLPHTIFNLNKEHELCVLEMGMNSFGEISKLADIVKPDIAIITNIGTAHIEFLKTRENILKAKMEITEFFKKENILIINGDDEMLKTIKHKGFNIIKFGLGKGNNIYAFNIKQVDNDGMEFCVNFGNTIEAFFIPLIGIHNVYNGLCAVALGYHLGIDSNRIREGLLHFKPPAMRMESYVTGDGITIINDSYNANPQSVEASIKTLAAMKSTARKVAILGDMMELGEHSEVMHYEAGEFIAKEKIDVLIAIGERAKGIQLGAVENGIPLSYHYTNKNDALKNIKEILIPYDIVLIKGSRAGKLEDISDFLRERR